MIEVAAVYFGFGLGALGASVLIFWQAKREYRKTIMVSKRALEAVNKGHLLTAIEEEAKTVR